MARKDKKEAVFVEGVDIVRHVIFATIPAWSPHQIVMISFEDIDEEVLRHILGAYWFPREEWMAKGCCRVFAEVNLGAVVKEGLRFQAWSIK